MRLATSSARGLPLKQSARLGGQLCGGPVLAGGGTELHDGVPLARPPTTSFKSSGVSVSAVSFLVIAVLAQPLQHRVEVHGGASTFWYASVGNHWDQVRGDVLLDARRSSGGVALARLMVSVLRGDELWTVELSQLPHDEMFVDADLEGPGGPVHAAVAGGAGASTPAVPVGFGREVGQRGAVHEARPV